MRDPICDGKPLPSAPRCGRDLGFPLYLFMVPLVYWPLRCTTLAHVCHTAPWLRAPGNLCSPHPARTIGQILEGIERPGDCPGASQDCDGEACGDPCAWSTPHERAFAEASFGRSAWSPGLSPVPRLRFNCRSHEFFGRGSWSTGWVLSPPVCRATLAA